MNHKNFSRFSRVALVFIFSVFNFLSCTKKLTPEQIEEQRILKEKQRNEAIAQAKENAISEYVASLSDSVKISQLFLVNIEGNNKYHSVEKTGSLF